MVNVKTGKGRKISSTLWLRRQLNDPYIKQAEKDKYRSRAAYKLLEINEKAKFLKAGITVIDLGAAPGSWLQVVQRLCKKNVKIIGIDLLKIEPIEQVTLLQGDFLQEAMQAKLIDYLKDGKADVILSDMAANTTGHKSTDHLRTMTLCEEAFNFACAHLKEGGTFVAKIFKGGTENELLAQMKKSFTIVKHVKPKASRKESSENYVVATGFRGSH